MESRLPSLILYLDFVDANDLVAGVFNLKGMKVFKSNSASDCISILEKSNKIDLVLLNREVAVKNDFLLLKEIRKISPDIMIVILTDREFEDEKLSDQNVHESVIKPVSPENLADKILMMMAKMDLRESQNKINL